jgi:hypothetical protein
MAAVVREMFVLFVLVAAALKPRPFPRRSVYVARLVTNANSKLCANCTFNGKHYFDASPGKLYGFVQWVYGKSAERDVSKLTNFMDVFLGNQQKMVMVTDQSQASVSGSLETKASCMIIPHTDKVFNETWATNAKYLGDVFWHGRLARKFSGVFPFFIQGEVYEGFYYEDALSPFHPVGYENQVMDLELTDFRVVLDVDLTDDMFTSVLQLEACKSQETLV